MSGGLVLLALLAAVPRAQTPQAPSLDTAASVARAAATITGAEFATLRTALLADSMRGPTPSAAVDRAARYVAAQLRALGVSVPRVSDTLDEWSSLAFNRYAQGMHRYPVPGQVRVDYQRSIIKFWTVSHGHDAVLITENGEQANEHLSPIPLTAVARVLDTAVAPYQISSFFDMTPADAGVLIAGPQTLKSLREVDVGRRLVIYVPPRGQDTATQAAIVQDLAARSGGVVVVSAADSTTFAARQRDAEARPPAFLPFARPNGSWAVEVWPRAVDQVLQLNGIDVAALRSASAPVVRPLPYVTATMSWSTIPTADTVTAPTIVIVVPGRDSSLEQRENVVLEAALDDGPAGGPEAAASVAGLLVLAKAFMQPGAQPRCSLVLLFTSGHVGQWGSRYFLSSGSGSTIPGLSLMLDLRSPLADSVLFVDGGREIKAELAPTWVAALHPELGMTATDTGSVLTNDAAASFTERWLPTLVLRAGGNAAAANRRSSLAIAGDTATAAGMLRLMFYTIRALANAERLPQWTPAARQQISVFRP